MTIPTALPAPAGESGARAPWSIRRSTTGSRISATSLGVFAIALFTVPQFFSANVVQQLTSLFIFMILAVMWNALAGYGGLVSVGQQAFVGFGAYGTIFFTQHGVSPYLAVVLAAFASGGLAVLLAPLVLRLRGGQFAIGTWVVAEALALLIALDKTLGGGTGVSLHGLNVYPPDVRRAYTYQLTLAFLVGLLALLVLLLRHRVGAALQAIRDDEEAAASVGVRVAPLKFTLFVLAGFGCGAAGALILANSLFIQPQSIFGVQWTAYMIFMVLVGGLGTFEGPLLGAVLLFGVQYEFAQQGAWYLIGLGATAVAFALFMPRGIWPLVTRGRAVQIMPVGYRLRRRDQLGVEAAAVDG